MTGKRFEVFSTSVAQIWRCLQKLKANGMAPYGLRGAHVTCLHFLVQADKGLTVSEISELGELDKGAVSRAVAELEKEGYVAYPEPEDKRRYRTKIVLTPSGRQISAEVDRAISEAVESAGRGLTDKEREIFYKGLTLIASNLQALSEEQTANTKG